MESHIICLDEGAPALRTVPGGYWGLLALSQSACTSCILSELLGFSLRFACLCLIRVNSRLVCCLYDAVCLMLPVFTCDTAQTNTLQSTNPLKHHTTLPNGPYPSNHQFIYPSHKPAPRLILDPLSLSSVLPFHCISFTDPKKIVANRCFYT